LSTERGEALDLAPFFSLDRVRASMIPKSGVRFSDKIMLR